MSTVAIIGASRGIGREFVGQYLADGWSVCATARHDRDLAQLRDAGAIAIAADVADEASLLSAAADLPTIDLLVLNAGVNTRRYERALADVVAEDWERVMRVNALGPLLAARAFAPRLRPGGTIVAISSKMGSIGGDSGPAAYSYRMSKAALNMAMTRLQMESPDLAVAVLHPGWVKTDMGGDQAPVEIADSVAGMRAVIARLKTGECVFRDYLGTPIEW
jgi:NAD(P)-dependent dehydrogenase (short-subunit alcohol dehydrogenase family)